MIKPGSLSLIEETTTYALYRFEPVSDDDDDAKFQRNLDRLVTPEYTKSIKMLLLK